MKLISQKRTVLSFLFGVLALVFYLISVRPLGTGYTEDICNHQMARQIMAENLSEFGRPVFRTNKIMAPEGMSAPFFAGWNVERDWIGGYVFQWNRDFPFLWVYYGVSLLVCYLGTGWILGRMGLSGPVSWGLALVCVLFNIPRHFKLWHHSDNVMMHWVYLSFFLDAWIWQRFLKERKWSVHLELWRGFLMLGVMNTMGYFWGPCLMEWAMVRAFMAKLAWDCSRRNERIEIEYALRGAILPVVLGLPLLLVDLSWFLELFRAASKQGEVIQPVSFFANLGQVLRPLWLERIFKMIQMKPPFEPLDAPETVVGIGWFYLIPLWIGISRLRSSSERSDRRLFQPFLIVFVVAILYLMGNRFIESFVYWVQWVVPFMKFFRTASRFGLFLTPLAAVMIALAWPRLIEFIKERKGVAKVGLVLFFAASLVEMSWIAYPVNQFPKQPDRLMAMMKQIKDAPGDTVLSMPFCVAGANGICTQQQCNHYPFSTMGACLRIWHDKKVYGAYASRMAHAECTIYDKEPYRAWLSAWREDRCLADAEWKAFCSYLKKNQQLSAILVFPDLWRGAKEPQCGQKFRDYLGDPIDSVSVMSSPTRGGEGAYPTRIDWYAPNCREF